MKNVKLAARYAKALHDFSLEKGKQDQVYQDILLVKSVLKENRSLDIVIESPIIPHATKVKTFAGIFEQKIDSISFGFLRLVIDKKREPELLLICEEFIKLHYRYNNIKVVNFITAKEVNPLLLEKLKALMQEKTGSTIELQVTISPDIIGGFVLKIEDFVYDESIKKQINILKREFSHNIYQAGF
jgi:ATP synthase, F1 delta subunit